MTVRKITFIVHVVGGLGSANFYANGKLQLVAVKVPRTGAGADSPPSAWVPDPINDTCTYDYDIQDEDNFGLAGYPRMKGDQSNLENKVMGERECTFTILNAQQNGYYLVRLYWESQP